MMTMKEEPIRVLLVEDDEDDYLITKDMLTRQQRVPFSIEWCPDYERGLQRIRQQEHDVYLIDYRLGPHTGLELIRNGFTATLHAPVIILTGEADPAIDLEASSLGVTDYLIKQELDPVALERCIRYSVAQHKSWLDLHRTEERYALAVRAASDGIWDWDLEADRIYLSPRWHAILGLPDRSREEDPSTWFDLVYPDDLIHLRAAIDAHLAGQTPHLQSEHRMRHADGGWRWVLTRGLVIRNSDGQPTRMAGSMSDISHRRAAEQQLQHDALHDSLTGLPNRALFMDRMEQLLKRAERDQNVGCAVLFLDIDRFKLVNDSFSHAVGDSLLVALARRISAVLRPGDTVARIGGDEFTLLLDEVGSAEDAMVVAERVRAALGQPFKVSGHELFVTASIGISLGGPRLTTDDLLRNADIAMYDAKRQGRARCTIFDETMHRRVVDRLARENRLRQAVEQGRLGVHYQPIIDLATGRIRSLEALARWPETDSDVPPVEFIPIAEETGMIVALGMHVLRTALETFARWRGAGLISDQVKLSVNISGRQLEEPGLSGPVRAALNAAGVPPEMLRLEITESTLMRDPGRMQSIISQVCKTGVGLHLDDFGTGYSSLAALHRFPVDALKIDRSFVSSLTGEDGGSDVIVRSTVALAHSLGLQVIAEGIEDEAQLRRLRTLGCEYGQGFLFSPPMSAVETELLLAGWSAAHAAAMGDRLPTS